MRAVLIVSIGLVLTAAMGAYWFHRWNQTHWALEALKPRDEQDELLAWAGPEKPE
jgi:hypothetical protein